MNDNNNTLRLYLDLEHIQLLKNVILFTPSESFHLTPQQVCVEFPSLARVENLILQEAVQTKKGPVKRNYPGKFRKKTICPWGIHTVGTDVILILMLGSVLRDKNGFPFAPAWHFVCKRLSRLCSYTQ